LSNWCDFILSIFGCQNYEQQYKTTLSSLEVCVNDRLTCLKQKHELEQENKQLKLLVPLPPPPKIDYIVEKDSAWVQQRLESMELNIVRLPLDENYRLTNRKNFANVVTWDITDRLEYVRDFFDCDKFAMLFKVMVNLIFRLTQVVYIVDYKSGHSYDLILYPDSEPMVFEPQNDGMYLWTKRLTDFYSLEGAYALI
jgi:hypothetical protein